MVNRTLRRSISFLVLIAGWFLLQTISSDLYLVARWVFPSTEQNKVARTTSTSPLNPRPNNAGVLVVSPSTSLLQKHQNDSKENIETRTTPPLRYNRTLTLLVPFQGELGNFIRSLSKARSMQRYVEKQIPGIRLELVGEHQVAPRWKSARRDLTTCFPNLRYLEFEGGRWDPSFPSVKEQQEKWLGPNASKLEGISTKEQIVFLRNLLDEQEAQGADPNIPPSTLQSASVTYSLPYLSSQSMPDRNFFKDLEAYRDIRNMFAFDTAACCKARAHANESVFHFRNFYMEHKNLAATEKEKIINGNYVELSPSDTVEMLFNVSKEKVMNYPKEVAIISRFSEMARPYLAAFQSRGWKARLIQGQTGVQDFCFAMSTKQALVGAGKSTYARWAGVLGNATLVRKYHVSLREPPNFHKTSKSVWAEGREYGTELYGRREVMTLEKLGNMSLAHVQSTQEKEALLHLLSSPDWRKDRGLGNDTARGSVVVFANH